jgi:outer membrane protein
MFKKIAYIFLILTQASWATTPKDLWENVVKSELSVEKSKAESEQSRLEYDQIKSAFFPSLDLKAKHTKFDPYPGSTSTTNPSETVWVNLSQTIFNGTREYYGLKEYSFKAQAAQSLLSDSELKLYEKILSEVYKLLTVRSDLKNTDKQLKLLNQRVAELQRRLKIGRSRRSEVLQASSQAASLEATLQDLLVQEKSAAHELKELLQLPEIPQSLSLNSSDEKIPDLNYFISRISSHPKATSLQKLLEASDYAIGSNRSLHFPVITFDSNYYLSRDGSYKDSDWDFSVNLTLPLFSGGETSSKVQESVEKKTAISREQKIDERDRSISITNLHQQIMSNPNREKSLEQALKLSEENYQENLKESQLGVISNLDLMGALQSFIEAQKTWDKFLLEKTYKINLLYLAIGEIK